MIEPEFHPGSATLLLEQADFAELVAAAAGNAPQDAAARERLAAAGALERGVPHAAIAGGVQAALAPVVELELQQGAARADGWADGFAAALLLPREERHQLHVVPTAFLPAALARVNELGPRPRAEAAERRRLTAGELAQELAGRADLRRHWRVDARWPAAEGSPGVRHVEVLDTEGGLWLVVPDGDDVELWPTTPTTVWRLLSGLLPRDEELDFDRL